MLRRVAAPATTTASFTACQVFARGLLALWCAANAGGRAAKSSSSRAYAWRREDYGSKTPATDLSAELSFAQNGFLVSYKPLASSGSAACYFGHSGAKSYRSIHPRSLLHRTHQGEDSAPSAKAAKHLCSTAGSSSQKQRCY